MGGLNRNFEKPWSEVRNEVTLRLGQGRSSHFKSAGTAVR